MVINYDTPSLFTDEISFCHLLMPLVMIHHRMGYEF